MIEAITVTQMRAKFGEYLDRAKNGEVFCIVRKGKIMSYLMTAENAHGLGKVFEYAHEITLVKRPPLGGGSDKA